MMNALSIDVEDWFQVENLKSAIPRESWDAMELRVDTNVRRILDLLEKHDVKATFFVLGWVAERCPALIRDIARGGHEIASHGFEHRLVYDLSPKAFHDDVLRSMRVLEDIVGQRIAGYRAPSFSITPATQWALEVLGDLGFQYDSSVFPVSIHDRYGFPGADTRPFRWPNGVLEIPLPVYTIGRFALPAAGGGYFRLLPYRYFRNAFQRLNRSRQRFTFYLHPWEIDSGQPRVKAPALYRFRHYLNLHKTERRLQQLLRDFRFSTISHAYQAELTGRGSEVIRLVLMIDRIGSNLAGTENQLLKLIAGLDRTRFDVHLVCLDDRPWFQEHRSELNCSTYLIPINRLRSPATYVNFARLVRLLRRLSPQIVHTFFPVANIVGVLAARCAGVGSIVSSRRDYGEWMLPHYLAATRFANHFVERIVTNSPQVSRLTQRMEGVPEKKMEVIYNGIDVSSFKELAPDANLRHALSIPPGKKIVGIVGNFRPMKRHETFLRAAREILRRRDDVEFLLLGEAFEAGRQEELDAHVISLGLAGKVHFVGRRPDVMRFLSIMDVGVNCSQGEGLSNAVMEYMAAGVPCVVSRSGGNTDLVSHDVNGLLFELDDHVQLATAVVQLLDDPEHRSRLVDAARQRIEAEMSLRAMVDSYSALYSRLAAPQSAADGGVRPREHPFAIRQSR